MSQAIIVKDLGKRFRRFDPHRPKTLQELFLKGLHRFRAAEHFWGLKNINFNVNSGCAVGIIGHNGAGKSTLLRLIGGVGLPDKGVIWTQGRIGALLDLGAGFHPDLTGRENVFISGVIAGLTRRKVAERFEAIVNFAELEAFIDNPLRTYSTGMQMRLAFAVAAHIDPDILLIDEVLAVGDVAFQRKCLDRIARFKSNGCTILLVSHDATLVKGLCDEAVWLRQGQVAAQGAAEVVVGQYTAEMTAETRRRTPVTQPVLRTADGSELQINKNRFGSLEIEIKTAHLLDSLGNPVSELESGEPLQVQIEYDAPRPVAAPIFSVTVSREDGFICYDTSTVVAGLEVPELQGQGKISLHLQRLDLIGGTYYLDVGIYERNWTYAYDYHWHVYPLLVHSPLGEKGVLRPPHFWQLDNMPTRQAAQPVLHRV